MDRVIDHAPYSHYERRCPICLAHAAVGGNRRRPPEEWALLRLAVPPHALFATAAVATSA